MLLKSHCIFTGQKLFQFFFPFLFETYSTDQEARLRRQIFASNVAKIEEYNKERHSDRRGVNKFAGNLIIFNEQGFVCKLLSSEIQK